jgi:hypothetical protein
MSPMAIIAIVAAALGVVLLVVGMRTRNDAGRIVAPFGALLIASGVRHLLNGVVPDPVLLSAGGVALAGVIDWMVQASRADNGDVQSR